MVFIRRSTNNLKNLKIQYYSLKVYLKFKKTQSLSNK